MEPDVERLVKAAWRDAKQTWSVDWEYFKDEAERQLKGEKPRGGPGVFLNDILKRAGYIS